MFNKFKTGEDSLMIIDDIAYLYIMVIIYYGKLGIIIQYNKNGTKMF